MMSPRVMPLQYLKNASMSRILLQYLGMLEKTGDHNPNTACYTL